MIEICNLHRKCLLLEAAKQFCQPSLRLAGIGDTTISACIAQLLEAKRTANRRAVYIKSLASYLFRFANERDQKAITEFSSVDIEAWLKQFSGYTRQTWLNRLSTLFSFAVRLGFIDKNPCDCIERVTVDKKPPQIFTASQADLLLRVVPNLCRAYLILGMFAGVRPDEIMRANWSDIDLETKTVRVDGKTRRRRIVPLEPRAAALLAGCPLQTGPVAPSNSTIRRFKRTARLALGLPAWPTDVLRHTAASYLLALYGDAGKVSTRLGNSAAILLAHYHEPVRQAEMQKFWSLTANTTNDSILKT